MKRILHVCILVIFHALIMCMFGCSRKESVHEIINGIRLTNTPDKHATAKNAPVIITKEATSSNSIVDMAEIDTMNMEFYKELDIATEVHGVTDIANIPLEELSKDQIAFLAECLKNNPTVTNEIFELLYRTDIPAKIDGLTAAHIAENLLLISRAMPNCDASNLLMNKAALYTRYYSEQTARDISYEILERSEQSESREACSNSQTLILLSYATEGDYDKADAFADDMLKMSSLPAKERYNIRCWSSLNHLIDGSNHERYFEGIQRLKILSEDETLDKEDRDYCKMMFNSFYNSTLCNLLKNKKP